MKHHLTRKLCAAVLLFTAFFSCVTVGAEKASPTPQTVVQSLLDAMAKKDAPGIRSAFAKDASQAYGDGKPKSGEAFFRWLESDIIARQGRVEDPKLEVKGNTVVVTGVYKSEGYTNRANFLFTVDDGLITSWRMRY